MKNKGDNKKKTGFKYEFTRYFLLVALTIFVVFFYCINTRFLTYLNIMNILRETAIMAILSMSAMFVLMVGELNFGIGAEATLAASILGTLYASRIVPSYPLCFLAVLIIMLPVSWLNSRLTCYVGIPAFIATLATSKLWDSTIYKLTGGKTFFSNKWGDTFTLIGQGYTGPIPNLFLGLVIMTILAWITLEKTRVGRHIQAAGGNAAAAAQVGIPVRRVKCIAFFLTTLFASVSGMFLCSKTGNITPFMGSNIMMDAICSAMLGATFWRIGRFNIPGTLVASCMMAVISNGLTTMGAADWMQFVLQGVMLTIAVAYIALTREEGLPGVKLA